MTELIDLNLTLVANDQYEEFGGKRWRVVGVFSSAKPERRNFRIPNSTRPKPRLHKVQGGDTNIDASHVLVKCELG